MYARLAAFPLEDIEDLSKTPSFEANLDTNF
jgi:hypothetical protein